MDKKNKQILKDSALTIADQIVSNIPALNIAWGLSRAFLGASLKLRQQRALEWVEMVRDNPSVFSKQVISDESFQMGLLWPSKNILLKEMKKKEEFSEISF